MRLLKWVLLLFAVVSSPTLLFCALWLLDPPDPMAQLFAFSFEVVNQTADPLIVTPVGAAGPDAERYPLPQVHSELPPSGALDHRRIPIDPHSSVLVTYDWDDINFSEIVVENPRGELRQLVVDPRPTEGQYHPPVSDRYELVSFERLDPLSPAVAEALERPIPSPLPEWVTPVSGAVPVLSFLAWWAVRKRVSTRSAQRPAG